MVQVSWCGGVVVWWFVAGVVVHGAAVFPVVW